MKRLPALAAALTLALSAPGGSAVAHETDHAKPRQPRQPRTPEMVRSSGGDGGRTTAVHQSPPDAPRRRTPAPTPTAQPSSVPERIAAAWPGSDWAALAVTDCETGGTYKPTAYSPAGPYYGLWQFDVPTWRSVGGSGLPSEASVEEQTRRAWDLRQRRGWVPWPACSRKAGLR